MRPRRDQQPDSIYTLCPPDHTERRADEWLLVWKDIPHWTVVDADLYHLLCELDGRRSLEDIVASYPEWSADRADVTTSIAALEQSGAVTANTAESREAAAETKLPQIENVALNITRRCNLACKFCYNLGFPAPEAADELSAAEIWSFLLGVKPMLAKKPTLTILGGEPLLRADDLLWLSSRARWMGLSTIVSTNGTLITDRFAAKAAKIGLQVQVSLDGHHAELHDAVRGPGAFDRTLGGIRTLIAHKTHTILSMVCHEGNIEHLEGFDDFALSLGATEARFIPLKQIGGGIDGGFAPVTMSRLMKAGFDLFSRRPELLKLAGRDAFSILADTCSQSLPRRSCGTGLQTFLLDSDGSIYPCLNTNLPEFKISSIRERGFDFKKMWQQSPALRNFRKQTAVCEAGAVCAECIVRHWCIGGCRGETYLSTRRLDGKPTGCSDLRKTIIETMWMISERPDLAKSANLVR